MPRLTPQLIRHAAHIDRYLPLLLRECRDLDSARNELRWIKEAVQDTTLASGRSVKADAQSSKHTYQRHLTTLIRRRANGEPLQYVLGTQPFGDLEIKCKPGVLIPRPETEIYTLETARIVQEITTWSDGQERLSIVDFCTGSGCIALLLHSILRPPKTCKAVFKQLNITAFDISRHALSLCRDNLDHNITLNALHEDAHDDIRIERLDVLDLAQRTPDIIKTVLSQLTSCNDGPQVIISNPPYISPAKYKPGGETARSVRNFEPKLALVPSDINRFGGIDQADQFYAALLKIASACMTKLLVMEVGDTEQALRVRELCTTAQNHHVEIWRDDSSIIQSHSSQLHGTDRDAEAEARAVFVWLDPTWARWRHKRLERANR